jgi:ligand-binding SRPBCC domain-containing protein
MKIYTLTRQQWIGHPLEEVFAYFADAYNLQHITPDWLHFEILTPRPIAMTPGAMIAYKLRLHGLPIRWLTEITCWEPPHKFVDVQLKGPYRLWEHTHHFRADNGGTLIHDEVRYALPLGFVSGLAHRWLVRKDLDAIFDFRLKAVEAHFAKMTTSANLPGAVG